MNSLLEHIIKDPEVHCRWLSTLSYLELCGARKIAGYLPKSLHNGDSWSEESEILQHAAEEFRHAYFFHKLISKIKPGGTDSFPKLCKRYGSRYLHILDLRIARQLRTLGHTHIRKGCYLLTTYAIEKRAQELYGAYESLLKAHKSPISIRSILIEETGHLAQIEEEIAKDPLLISAKEDARRYEEEIFSEFWEEVRNELSWMMESSETFIFTNRWTNYDKISSSCG